MKNITSSLGIISLCILLLACGNPNQRLDEYVFYNGPQFKLKVVRYYRNIPFNQLGQQAIVMCRSDNTRSFPAYEQQDAGWRMLGSGDAQDSKDAKEAALGLKDDYEVFDDHTLIGKVNVFNISFDACGHFINWDPGRLPQALIDPVEKPDSCAPNGPADCRYLDFEGDRTPQYKEIRIPGTGQVSFSASSPTFRGVELLRVQTRNNGAVWHVETVGPEQRELQPDTIRSLPVSLLENGMDDISLIDWLESVLPPRSMVVWPGATGVCDDRDETDERSSIRCADILFSDAAGNNGTLYIAIHSAAGNGPREASFYSGVYKSGDSSRLIGSLAGLREILAAGKE